MDFISAHFGEFLTAGCTIGMAIMTAYIAVKISLARSEERHIAERELRETFQKWEMEARTKLEAKVERHVENSDIHYHRRETDGTGRWPNYQGN